MSHKSFSDIIEDTLDMDSNLIFGYPLSTSNLMSKIRFKFSTPYKDSIFRNVYIVKNMVQVIKNF